jgi:hypothetical protein
MIIQELFACSSSPTPYIGFLQLRQRPIPSFGDPQDHEYPSSRNTLANHLYEFLGANHSHEPYLLRPVNVVKLHAARNLHVSFNLATFHLNFSLSQIHPILDRISRNVLASQLCRMDSSSRSRSTTHKSSASWSRYSAVVVL